MGMEPWVLGVLLAILAALAGAIGDNIVKYSFRRAEQDEEKGVRVPPLHKRPLWLLGIFNMVVLNTSLNVASYAFADASLTIPLGGLHILFNIPLAKVLNKEQCSRKAVMYNCIIMIGVIVVLVAAPKESTFFTTHQMFLNLFSPIFIAFSALIGMCVLYCVKAMRSKDLLRRRLGFTSFAGCLGATTQVAAKAMSGCIKDGGWLHPFLWASVGVTIVLALSQVHYLNKCLELFDATFVVPIVNAILICVGSMYAAIYFEEMTRWELHSCLLVPLGIGLTAVGIGLLSTDSEATGNDGEGSVSDTGVDLDTHDTLEPLAPLAGPPQTATITDLVASEAGAMTEPGGGEEYIRLDDI